MNSNIKQGEEFVSPSTASTEYFDTVDSIKDPSFNQKTSLVSYTSTNSAMPIRKRLSTSLSPNFIYKKQTKKQQKRSSKSSKSPGLKKSVSTKTSARKYQFQNFKKSPSKIKKQILKLSSPKSPQKIRQNSFKLISTLRSNSFASNSYYSSSDVEDEEDYKKGGYHRVTVGEIFNNEFKVVKKLGWGHFSTVWLVSSLSSAQICAMKVQKSSKNYTEAAHCEIEILQFIKKKAEENKYQSHVVDFLSSFSHTGPNGTHICMVFEHLGNNLLGFIKAYDYYGAPLELVKQISYQVLLSFKFLHEECKVLHTDMKPENVLIAGFRGKTAERLKDQLSALSVEEKEYKSVKLKHIVNNFKLVHFQEDAHFDKVLNLDSEISLNLIILSNSEEIKQLQKCFAGEEENVEEMETDPTELLDVLAKQFEATINQNPILETLRLKKPLLQHSLNLKSTRKEIISTLEALETLDFKDFHYRLIISNKTNIILPIKSLPEDFSSLPFRFHYTEKKQVLEIGEQLVFQEKTQYDISVKTVDLGNACFINKPFQSEIQTRQYRAPEAIIVAEYGPPADIWSIACMLFELATGDMLFHPKERKGLSKDLDHVALILELLIEKKRVRKKGIRRVKAASLFGGFKFAFSGRDSRDFFYKDGKLKQVKEQSLKFWGLKQVLNEKYKMAGSQVDEFCDFLLRMLQILPENRETATQLLQHNWFKSMSFIG
eukprot:snap_masked-scaffold_3-processed-gene-21.77-mRNA-1 protein AED:0.06 eAED:0.07 QI:0/-1/0/1/-1/1/1/0/713